MRCGLEPDQSKHNEELFQEHLKKLAVDGTLSLTKQLIENQKHVSLEINHMVYAPEHSQAHVHYHLPHVTHEEHHDIDGIEQQQHHLDHHDNQTQTETDPDDHHP